MTAEEEAVLKEYLFNHEAAKDDEDFEQWYRQRFEDSEAESYYKQTLEVAQVWMGKFEEGFKAGITHSMLRPPAFPARRNMS